MKLRERIKREKIMRPIMRKGFSRKMASVWYRKIKNDYKKYGKLYNQEILNDIHSRGYLARSIRKYDLLKEKDCRYISDFEYIFLSPINNSFSKWIDDILTTNRILSEYKKFCREVYFSIIERNRKKLIFKVDDEKREYIAEDIFSLLKEKRILELRPSFWLSKKKRYKLEYVDNLLRIDGFVRDIRDLEKLINSLNANYIISEYVDLNYGEINGNSFEGYIKLYVTNDQSVNSTILAGYMNLLWYDLIKSNANGKEYSKRRRKTFLIDLENGTFEFYGIQHIKNWETIRRNIEQIGEVLKPINFFSVSASVEEAGFKILSFSANPYLPENDISKELNSYLKTKFQDKRESLNLTFKDRFEAIKISRFHKFVKRFRRAGMRPYMQRLWFDAIKDDFKNTKKSINKKIWAWRRGFLSYRIDQYGLNSSNYKEFLSDYDYYWLNRINNSYQIWINDKTTFRYILDPFKEYIPDYYYLIFRRNGKLAIEAMQDCPKGLEKNVDGILELLKTKKKLALKPSAGTHGDGFYCLAYDNGDFFVNGEVMTKDEIIQLINEVKVFYLVTDFINMNSELKKIYDKSVNSVRVMVINKYGYNPQIMQAYMRIGSVESGYTDNVGYGGICVMIDIETGRMYNPEQIIDHKFQPCEVHPDTGVLIEGKIPNWDMMCNKILEICRFMPELEYLGFDIAITDESFQIIEINIHQDLHKVATYSEEIKEYFRDKLENKRVIYKI